jgi:hypothetical protein
MNFREEINQQLKSNRPQLSDSSCKTYISLLSGLCKSLNIEPNKSYLMNPQNSSIIIETLSKQCLNSRKAKYSAMFVLTGNDDYRELMMDDLATHVENENKQEMNTKQQENWMSFAEIKSLYDAFKDDVKPLWKKKVLLPDELVKLQQFVIYSLVSGVLIPPRRLMDYTEFKIRNVDNDTDNYMTNNEFVFNQYKTAKTYGRQVIPIPKTLSALIKKWMKIQTNDYLLTDTNGNKLTEVQLNQRIRKLFDTDGTGNNISVNMLRHIYTTEKVHKHTPSMKKLQTIATAMGHSITQNILYKKTSPSTI